MEDTDIRSGSRFIQQGREERDANAKKRVEGPLAVSVNGNAPVHSNGRGPFCMQRGAGGSARY